MEFLPYAIALVILCGVIFFVIRQNREDTKKKKEEERKEQEMFMARQKNPPRVFLPNHRELVGFSASCHGLSFIVRVLPDMDLAVPKEITVQLFGRASPVDTIDQFFRHLIIVQGGEYPKNMIITNSPNLEHIILPRGTKLVLAQLGCHNIFLTCPTEPSETPNGYETYTLNESETELLRTNIIKET